MPVAEETFTVTATAVVPIVAEPVGLLAPIETASVPRTQLVYVSVTVTVILVHIDGSSEEIPRATPRMGNAKAE